MKDRAILLTKKAGPKRLSEIGGDYERWKNISRGIVRIGADELEVLAQYFPSYSYWLISGEIAPEIGQTSPAYDEANEKLDEPNLA